MSVTIPTDAFGRIIGGAVTTTQTGNIEDEFVSISLE